MVRKDARPAPKQPKPSPQPPPESSHFRFGYNPAGPTEQRDIVSSKDGWSEYTLNDGSVIRAKAVIIDVKCATDQYSADGNPLYIVQTDVVNSVNAPAELKKKST